MVHLSIHSVLFAAILMAPLTVLVWRRTLERLEAQRRIFEKGE
jgi:hypothetical protein